MNSCKNTESREKNIKKRLDDFRKVLEKNEVLVEFDRQVFESIIDKVIVSERISHQKYFLHISVLLLPGSQ